MKTKDFKFGKPVLPPYFVNREEELNNLYNLTASIKEGGEKNVALIGLRRTGKTSLLKNLEDKFKRDGEIIPVFIDCYGIPSKTTFAKIVLERVRESYIINAGDRSYGKKLSEFMKKKTSEWLTKISSVDISIANYLSIKMAFKEGTSEDIWIRALEYPENLSNEKDVYFIIMLDEFPDIAMRWKEDFIKRLRSVIQHQKKVTYILSGSAVSFMAELAKDRSSPFYRQLVPVRVEELPEKVARTYISERLNIGGKALDEYIKLTGSFPDYIQRLGHILVERGAKRKISVRDVKESYNEMIWELDIEFSSTLRMLNNMSGIYGDILLAIAKNNTLSKIAEEIGVDAAYLSRYLNYLIQIGLIRRVGRGKYKQTDPVFRDWVISRFL